MNIQELLSKAVKKKASDVHLLVGLSPTIRVFGELVELGEYGQIKSKEMEQIIFSLISVKQKEKFLSEKELDFGYENKDGNRFRINLHFEKNNIGMVARVISDKIPSLDDIDIPEVVRDLLELKQGLILITGPTGCGKSTTLAAMINDININKSLSIITLEDPIEYIFEPIKSIIIQRQLGSDMKTFSDGLRHALRQDPNVIMVGEMRDLETISSAIT